MRRTGESARPPDAFFPREARLAALAARSSRNHRCRPIRRRRPTTWSSAPNCAAVSIGDQRPSAVGAAGNGVYVSWLPWLPANISLLLRVLLCIADAHAIAHDRRVLE